MAAKIKIDKVSINEFLNKYYAITAVLLVLIILTLTGILLIYPQYQKLITVQEEDLSSSQADLEKNTKYLNDLRQMEENFSTMNLENFRNLNKVMITENQFPLLFARLEAIVDSVDMTISNISYTPVIEEVASAISKNTPEVAVATDNIIVAEKLPNGINELVVNMTINPKEKNWEAFKNLLVTLENNIELIEIKNMSYVPMSSAYNLSFSIYYKDQDYGTDKNNN